MVKGRTHIHTHTKQINTASLTLSLIRQARAVHCPQSRYCSNKLKHRNTAVKHQKLLTIAALAQRKEKSNPSGSTDILCSVKDNRPKMELLMLSPHHQNKT